MRCSVYLNVHCSMLLLGNSFTKHKEFDTGPIYSLWAARTQLPLLPVRDFRRIISEKVPVISSDKIWKRMRNALRAKLKVDNISDAGLFN